MRWHEQLKAKFLKKVAVSNMEEQFQQKRLNYNTRRRLQRASETEAKRKERLKKRNEDREREHNDFCKRKGCRMKMERSKI